MLRYDVKEPPTRPLLPSSAQKPLTPSKIQVSHGDERAVRLSGTAFLRLQNLDQRNLAREHLIEVEPVRTYKVGLASPRERFQSVGRETGIANEQPARPGCLSA